MEQILNERDATAAQITKFLNSFSFAAANAIIERGPDGNVTEKKVNHLLLVLDTLMSDWSSLRRATAIVPELALCITEFEVVPQAAKLVWSAFAWRNKKSPNEKFTEMNNDQTKLPAFVNECFVETPALRACRYSRQIFTRVLEDGIRTDLQGGLAAGTEWAKTKRAKSFRRRHIVKSGQAPGWRTQPSSKDEVAAHAATARRSQRKSKPAALLSNSKLGARLSKSKLAARLPKSRPGVRLAKSRPAATPATKRTSASRGRVPTRRREDYTAHESAARKSAARKSAARKSAARKSAAQESQRRARIASARKPPKPSHHHAR